MGDPDHVIVKQVAQLVERGYMVKYSEEKNEVTVKFRGPPDSLYENGFWNVRVVLPNSYPMSPPQISFITKIMHPNIGKGKVCFSLLDERCWRPAFSLLQVFEYFLPQLLVEPNPTDPVDAYAADLYINHHETYEEEVKKTVAMFATEELSALSFDWVQTDSE